MTKALFVVRRFDFRKIKKSKLSSQQTHKRFSKGSSDKQGHFKVEKIAKLAFSFLLSVISVAPALAEQAQPTFKQIFYVNTKGNDSNPGTRSRPFKTIGGAIKNADLTPGSAVCVADGTYRETVTTRQGGNANSPTGYVTFFAEHAGKSKIIGPSDNYSVFNINNNYVVVQGFDVSGGGGGHAIQADQYPRQTGWHHIQIRNNICHDAGGSGINVNYGDWYNIEHNIVYRCCSTNPYTSSGISIWEPYPNLSFAPTSYDRSSTYHNIVYGNISHANMIGPNVLDEDGEGIILDTFGGFAYTGRSLVFGNLLYENGGRGIEVVGNYNAAANTYAPIDIFNNTCYNNNLDTKQTSAWRGELYSQTSGYVNFYNNIAQSAAGAKSNSTYNNTAFSDDQIYGSKPFTNVWYHNVAYNPTARGQNNNGMYPGTVSTSLFNPSKNKFATNPLFCNSSDLNFHLKASSPALYYGLPLPLRGLQTLDGQPMPSPPPAGAYSLEH